MSEKTKELALKKAMSRLKLAAKLPPGEVRIDTADQDAAKLLLDAGYSRSEAWKMVAEELRELQIEYSSNPIFGIRQKRITDAYEKMGNQEGYQLAKEFIHGKKIISQNGLENYLTVISATLIGGSALFLSSNITGNVIWELHNNEINLIGIAMFLVGLFGLYVSLRKK